MTRSTRSGRAVGGNDADVGRGRKRGACDLNETIDENDDELMRAIEESLKDVAETKEGKRVSSKCELEKTVGKGKRKTRGSNDGTEADKENNGVTSSQGGKRKKPKGLAEHRVPAASEATSPGATATSMFESPPIFAFRQGKTALKQRKMLKLKRREQDGSQQRIEELKAYFGSVDKQQLSFA